MEVLLKMVTVILWSAVKYIVGISFAIGFGFNPIETIVLTIGGGMLGVLVYLYAWALLLSVFYRFFPKKPKPVKFKLLTRKLVLFIRKYEVWGIAFLTPLLLTPPLGTILAASIEPNKWRIKMIMFLSFSFWTILILALKYLFHIEIGNNSV
ncbi:MAG: hypothetical protein LW669_04465 [Sphingobacteriales bacterium]|jgi:hypothetical protein|nr:hypothetical protein [Sphingobacteriales bacterium]